MYFEHFQFSHKIIRCIIFRLTDYGFTTGLPDGDYCDVITCDNPVPPCGNSGGTCRDTITVSGGFATITVPTGEDPMIAIHVDE